MIKDVMRDNTYSNVSTGLSRSHLKRIFRAATLDLMIVLAAYSIYIVTLGRSVMDGTNLINGALFGIIVSVVMLSMLYVFGIYHRIWERTSGHGISVIFNAVGAATVIMVAANPLLDNILELTDIVIVNLMTLIGFIAVRYRSRLISGAEWRWKAIWHQEFPKSKETRLLIVGAGEAGQTLAWRLKHRFINSDYRIMGFVDDDPEKQGMYVEGCRVLGGRFALPYLAETHNIDLIVVAIHNIGGPEFRDILNICAQTKARIKIVPDVFALMNATHSTTLLRDVQPEDLIGRNIVSQHDEVDMTPIINKVVLVTGAAGSIGSELSHQMSTYQPQKLLLLDANESNLHDLAVELSASNPDLELVPVLADITEREAIQAIYAEHRPQVVFHAAAYKHVPMLEKYPAQAVRVNVGGTKNVAELAQYYKAERFVLISTDKAVNPSSVMGASKRLCELMLHTLAERENNNTLFASVRFGNVLGSRGSVVPTFNSQIAKGGPVTITHPEMTRYFMSISEAVNLVIHAACMTKGDDVYLLKMGETVKIIELAERMIRLRGMRPYKDIEIQFTGVRPGEKLHEELYNGSEQVFDTIHPGIIQLMSYTKANISLQAVDTLLEEGLDDRADALTQLLWGMPIPYNQRALGAD
jgi:FlaA1/EpsC-like NDP-sugar epimerase